jgi:hypothetical protein
MTLVRYQPVNQRMLRVMSEGEGTLRADDGG